MAKNNRKIFDLGAGNFQREVDELLKEREKNRVSFDAEKLGSFDLSADMIKVSNEAPKFSDAEVVVDPSMTQEYVALHARRNQHQFRQGMRQINRMIFAQLYGGLPFPPPGYAVGAILGTFNKKEFDEPMPRFARNPPAPSRRYNEGDDPAVPPGKVCFTRGPGTFNARARLRALGGRWDQDLLGGCWVIPAEHGDSAEANIRLAERAGVELPLDDVVGETERITCYVCGVRYQPWEFAKLAGAVVTDWYCGCETRKKGPAPRTATTRTR